MIRRSLLLAGAVVLLAAASLPLPTAAPAPVPLPAPTSAPASTSSACYLLGSFNCVTWSSGAGGLYGCYWNTQGARLCQADFSATLSGWNWLTPGSATVSIVGQCSNSASWTEGSWSVSAACPVSANLAALTCGHASAQATGTIVSATTSPGYSDSLQSSDGCNPIKATVYHDAGYVDPCYFFSTYDMDLSSDEWGWNGCGHITSNERVDNSISSLKMRSGCSVTVWSDPNEGGSSTTFYGDTAYVGGAWNDVISSIWPSCYPNPPDV